MHDFVEQFRKELLAIYTFVILLLFLSSGHLAYGSKN